MLKLVVADKQPVFRAGIAKVLAVEDEMRIVAQAQTPDQIPMALERFRPNVLLDCGDEVGFIEQPWLGRKIAASSGAVLEGTEDCQRCALTTRAQGDLPSDPKILHTVMLENNTNAGIYARVATPGRIAVGDAIEVR